jgi:hypothetical protein
MPKRRFIAKLSLRLGLPKKKALQKRNAAKEFRALWSAT